MRVIITGGTGLIGTALTAELVAAGDEVVILSRHPAPAGKRLPGVEVVAWDGRIAAGWAGLAGGADAIVNLAGENLGAGRWTPARKRRLRDSRIAAGTAVVEAIGQAGHPPRVVVQASAVGYYGDRQERDLTEDAGPRSDFLARLCVDWEASTAPVEAMGVRRVIVRPGLVLSRAGGALPRLLLPYRLFVGGRIGSGRQGWPWIHILDEARAIRFLLENEVARGPYNLTAPGQVDNATFSRDLGRALARPSWVPVPGLALHLLLGELASTLLTGQWPSPGRLRQLGFVFRFPTLDIALRDLLG